MLDKNKLIELCWENLEFNNCPTDWTDTYIVDILNGYNNSCHTKDGEILKYSTIRNNFEITDYSDDE